MLERLFAARGYEVEVASDGRDAWRILEREDAPRLAILDWSMPGLDGLDICRRVRAAVDRPYTYIILLTAKGGSDDLVEAMEAGADDYLSKPFRVEELVARIRAGQRVVDLQAALLHGQEQLRVQATHDALTGEWNRATILAMLEREASRAARAGTSVGAFLFDIDRFKSVNDTHGHDAGDAVIRQTVVHLKSALRSYDGIGRYGGEEVLVVAPGCGPEGLWVLAERARLAVAGSSMIFRGVALTVTVSCGAVASGGRRGMTAKSLVTEADTALYRAKDAGRNRVELAYESAPLSRASGM